MGRSSTRPDAAGGQGRSPIAAGYLGRVGGCSMSLGGKGDPQSGGDCLSPCAGCFSSSGCILGAPPVPKSPPSHGGCAGLGKAVPPPRHPRPPRCKDPLFCVWGRSECAVPHAAAHAGRAQTLPPQRHGDGLFPAPFSQQSRRRCRSSPGPTGKPEGAGIYPAILKYWWLGKSVGGKSCNDAFVLGRD